MAGIGFALRRLARRDDLLGVVRAYTHSTYAASGPWVFTILSLGAISIWGDDWTSYDVLAAFRLIIIYNFAFSLLFSSPVSMVATRFLADKIFVGDVKEAPGMLIGALTMVFVVQAPMVAYFYLFHVELDPATRLAAVINYFLVAAVWIVSVFLTALKDYGAVSRSFAAGMAAAFLGCMLLARSGTIFGMLMGFSAGLSVILYSLATRILAEYPYRLTMPTMFLGYFRRYWQIAVSGFLYSAAVWVDNWIMWTAPERETLAVRMVSYPDYDSAVFLAYLSIIPAMSMFVISIETRFYERYHGFYKDIMEHATLARIEANHLELIHDLSRSYRKAIVLQTTIAISLILFAPKILEWLRLSFLQLAMYRLCVLGALFHALFLFVSILLSYFDMRKATLGLHLLFLVTNAGFTFVCMRLGFPYYGYGYFLSCLLTSVLALIVLARHLADLPYQTFVLNNAAIR